MVKLMMIRRNYSTQGLSLVESAFVMAIVAILLGAIWSAVDGLYNGVRVNKASQELEALVPVLREEHTSNILFTKEQLTSSLSALPSDLFEERNSGSVLLNPWGGLVTLFQGNAMGGGEDTENAEFTVSFDQVPSSACAPLVQMASGASMRSLGLVSIYIAPDMGHGDIYCFTRDSYCRKIDVLEEDSLKNSCHRQRHIKVMFSYAIH